MGFQKVIASYYGGTDGLQGGKTASGEIFDCDSFTAAHKTLPFGTQVLLKNPLNRKQVTVRINDRGPYTRGRSIDISLAAARALGITRKGVACLLMRVQS